MELNPSYSCGKVGSLPQCAGLGIEPVPPQRQCCILNLLHHREKSCNAILNTTYLHKIKSLTKPGRISPAARKWSALCYTVLESCIVLRPFILSSFTFWRVTLHFHGIPDISVTQSPKCITHFFPKRLELGIPTPYFFFFFVFSRATRWPMEVPRLGVNWNCRQWPTPEP